MAQEKLLEVKHPPINEQSSIVKSNSYENLYWVTNDSDDETVIFPLNSEGKIIIPGWLQKRYKKTPYPGINLLGAINNDWESMAAIKDTLIIADMGNNGNARRDLGIYFVLEPNPFSVYQTRALNWYPVHYEDQKNFPASEWTFDCEAIFSFEGKVYFLTKHRSEQNIYKPHPSTHLYRMDTRSVHRSNALKKIGSLDNLGGWVTGADMAPDESGLVLLAQNPLATSIWYFPRPKKGDDFLSEPPKRYNLVKADQAEAVCFKNNKTIIVTNEQREWFEIPLSKFRK